MVMRRKKIRLRYKKERVLFSDVLPYELPLIFTNRYFYRFVVDNGIWVDINGTDGCDILRWNKDVDEAVLLIISLLFGVRKADLAGKTEYKLPQSGLKRIPFVYTIQHKPSKHRYLSIIHPANQIKVVDFYNKYKDAIIYLCSKSNFSMRYPSKVASYFFYKDRLHHILLGQKTDKMEMFFSEYENLRTYFSYERYTNIYKFYDDYRYQRAEKKFAHLLKMDVQCCFDSIYTHSISWAINSGVSIYKDSFEGKSDGSVGAIWDKMMQEMNYNETNGIVIGPEFSRLFAEVILQHVDQRVEQDLLVKGYRNRVDYECYRYVDDYFFFYNDGSIRNEAEQLFQLYLKEFKLNLGQEKRKIMDRPFVTEITKAKVDIDELLNTYLKIETRVNGCEVKEDACLEESKEQDSVEDLEECLMSVDREKAQICLATDIVLLMKSTEINKRFKKIVTTNNVDGKDVLNYTISRISIRIERLLKKFDRYYKTLCLILKDELLIDLLAEAETKRAKWEKMLAAYLFEVIDTVFFLYAGSKRINTTLKVVQVLNVIRITLDHDYVVERHGKKETIERFTDYAREIVFKKIRDEISLVIQTAPVDENIQLETLYFLIVLKSMNRKYQLEPNELIKYLRITTNDTGAIKRLPQFNALSVIILVYYFGNIDKYLPLKKAIVKNALDSVRKIPKNRRRISAENVILALDMATCPYIRPGDREDFLKSVGLSGTEVKHVEQYLAHQRIMFTKWTGVDITKELNAKISQEVYS